MGAFGARRHGPCWAVVPREDPSILPPVSVSAGRGEGLFVYNAYIHLMTEVTVSARISKEMERELEEIMREEHLEKSAALRKLLHVGLSEVRQERALRLLAGGKVSFGRAAEIARMNLWEFADLVRERRIPWVADELAEDLPAPRRRD